MRMTKQTDLLQTTLGCLPINKIKRGDECSLQKEGRQMNALIKHTHIKVLPVLTNMFVIHIETHDWKCSHCKTAVLSFGDCFIFTSDIRFGHWGTSACQNCLLVWNAQKSLLSSKTTLWSHFEIAKMFKASKKTLWRMTEGKSIKQMVVRSRQVTFRRPWLSLPMK